MNTTDLIDEIRIKLALAESTEQHLRSAENALAEKDAELKRVIDQQEKTLLSISKRNISLRKAYNKMFKLAHYYKQTTKDLLAVNQQLSDRIIELTEDNINILALKKDLARHKAFFKDMY